MNYEQKYNDLINRLREYRERFGNPLYKEIGEEFPELRESEEERLRKELIEQVQFIVPKQDECDENGKELPCYRERIAKYIAYLEKQKEKKVDIDKLRKDIYQSGYNDGYQHGKEDAQKEQKPAEWSEEDEDFINMLILHFNYLIDKGGDSVETYKSYREKLKSLRPSWKPSKEQMEALESAVKLYKDTHFEIHHEKIVSLYEQLKAL